MDQKKKDELNELLAFREFLKTYKPEQDPEYDVNTPPKYETPTQIETGNTEGKRKSFKNLNIIPFQPQDFLDNRKNGFSNIFMLTFLTIFFEGLFLFLSFILFR